MTTIRFPDAWNWIRAGLLDATADGQPGRSISEIQIDGQPHRLVQLDADFEIGKGAVTLTYECWTEAL